MISSRMGIVGSPSPSTGNSNGAGTLAEMLHAASQMGPDRGCLVSADGQLLGWQQLLLQICRTAAALRAIGIGPDDRVALALRNGRPLAAAFLAIAACAGCAPLNPTHSEEEIRFYLSDLRPKVLITGDGDSPSAKAAARKLGIPVLGCDNDGAVLTDPARHDGATNGFAYGSVTPDSVGLYLYTSGTTSRPKLVPLRHKNLVASAQNMVAALELSPRDRCLNLMPLFHIHGLVGGLLAPLAGGGSVVCPPSLRPGDFFRWTEATQPTWYTAVPTMHRMVASEAMDHSALIRRLPLRFIRSSSAPLPAQLFDQLEQVFGCPVLEAYSMTEAAHQMTCNPLGAGKQRSGTVGVPAGPEVRIMDESGRLLPDGQEGEVVIRGPSVMSEYEANPAANATAFVHGWFRTGDKGRFDPDGYLVLTGRLKEQINRGGEKIAPLELDRVMLAHPDVIEAAAFGFPHPTLGEEIAAAVVLRPGATASSSAVQQFVREHVAPFKVPRRIVILDTIPKGATGKVQRGQLHKQLGVTSAPSQAPNDLDRGGPGSLEADLLRLWRKLLNSDRIGINDDFFEVGGDSLTAVEMLLEAETLVGHAIQPSILVEHPTIAQLAECLTSTEGAQARPLIKLQDGSRPPLFFFHGDYDGGYYTRRLARLIGPDQPFISVAPHGLGRESIPDSIETMATDRLPLLLQASGPFRLAGYCNGGLVALEVAKQLVDAGRRVDVVFLIDVPMLNLQPAIRTVMQGTAKYLGVLGPDWEARFPKLAWTMDTLWRQANNVLVYRRDPSLMRPAVAKLGWLATALAGAEQPAAAARSHAARMREFKVSRIYNRLFRKYIPVVTDLPVVYFAAEQDGAVLHRLGPNVQVVNIPGGHWGCITTHAETLAGHLRARLDQIERADERDGPA